MRDIIREAEIHGIKFVPSYCNIEDRSESEDGAFFVGDDYLNPPFILRSGHIIQMHCDKYQHLHNAVFRRFIGADPMPPYIKKRFLYKDPRSGPI
jgi:hypothetical protein